MTIQNWRLTPTQATIVCGSLASDANTDDMQPLGFASKAWIVPHLPVMIAVKNWMFPALSLWAGLSQTSLIDEWPAIVAAAPAHLRKAIPHNPGGDDLVTDCRVVMFGWHEGPAGCLFEGANCFEPQPMAYGSTFMPDLPGIDVLDDWQRALVQQQSDRFLAVADRDNIGGRLIRCELAAVDGMPAVTVRHLGIMPHYAEDRVSLKRS